MSPDDIDRIRGRAERAIPPSDGMGTLPVRTPKRTAIDEPPNLAVAVPSDGRETLAGEEAREGVMPPPPGKDVQSSTFSTWLNASRGLWLGAAAYVAALAGTLLLPANTTRSAGMLLLVFASVLGIAAWWDCSWVTAFSPAHRSSSLARAEDSGSRSADLLNRSGRNRRRLLSIGGIGLASLLLGLASSSYIASPAETFGEAGRLWLASMALLLVATAAWPRAARSNMSATSKTEVAASRHTDAPPQPWTSWEIGVFAGLVVLALVLRLWDLHNVPFAIHNDEVLTGINALDAYSADPRPSLFSTLWTGIDLPALWFYGVGLSLDLGDNTLQALRLPSALLGALTVVPFYGLVRSAWGRAAAIGGTAIMSFSVVDVHFSRITINNITTQFFWAACFYFLLRAVRERRPVDWALAGIFAGLSEHFYYGTRLLPLLLIAFAVYVLVVHWRHGARMLGGFALTALGFLAGFGPLLAFFSRNPHLYLGRGQGVLAWNRIPASWEDVAAMWDTLWPLMARNLLSFSTVEGTDMFYASTLLFPAEAALLVLGVGLLVWRWRHPAAFLMLLSGLGVLVVGGTLVPAAANINHWTPAFPAFFAAIAVPIGMWVASASAFSNRLRAVNVPKVDRLSYRAAAGVVAVGLAVLAATNTDYYFNRYAATQVDWDMPSAEHRFDASLARQGYRVRNVGRTYYGYDTAAMKFMVKEIDGGQLFNPASELPLMGDFGHGIGFVLRENDQYMPIVREFYPGGEVWPITSQKGARLFDAYVVPPEKAEAAYGVHLQIFAPGGKPRWEGKVPSVGALPDGMAFPLSARWSGAFYLGAAEDYQLTLQGTGARILVDGIAGEGSFRAVLQPGWHRYMVAADLSAPAPMALLIGRAGVIDPGAEIPRQQLWPEPPGRGLLGAVRNTSSIGVVPRVDPYIGFAAAGNPGSAGPAQGASLPIRARWMGHVLAPHDGIYDFSVRTDGRATLALDGNHALLVCEESNASDEVTGETPVALSAGWHALQLDYLGAPGNTYLSLWWSVPGGERTLIPPGFLRYMPGTAIAPPPIPAPPDFIGCPAP